MRRRLVVLIVAAMSLAAAMPAAAHDAPRRCGHRGEPGAGWWRLRAHDDITCVTGRRVAERWHNRVGGGRVNAERFRVQEQRWGCENAQYGFESVSVRCVRRADGSVVHFLWGS